MKKEEEIYDEWVRRRRSVTAPEDLERVVMDRIAGQADLMPRGLPRFHRVLWSRPARWAVAVGALLLAMFRLFYVATALLVP